MVLVIALIMLAVTLIGTVSANIVMGNLRVVQNIESRAFAKSSHIRDAGGYYDQRIPRGPEGVCRAVITATQSASI